MISLFTAYINAGWAFTLLKGMSLVNHFLSGACWSDGKIFGKRIVWNNEAGLQAAGQISLNFLIYDHIYLRPACQPKPVWSTWTCNSKWPLWYSRKHMFQYKMCPWTCNKTESFLLHSCFLLLSISHLQWGNTQDWSWYDTDIIHVHLLNWWHTSSWCVIVSKGFWVESSRAKLLSHLVCIEMRQTASYRLRVQSKIHTFCTKVHLIGQVWTVPGLFPTLIFKLLHAWHGMTNTKNEEEV